MGILDILTGGGLGAIGGAISAIGGKVIDLKLEGEKRETLKVQLEHNLAMRDKDIAQAAAEAASNLAVHQVDADSAAVLKDLDGLQASIAADRATYGDSWAGRIVDFVRGVTRPLITYAAMGMVIYTTAQVLQGVRAQPFAPDLAFQLLRESSALAATAIGWWFGARITSRKK